MVDEAGPPAPSGAPGRAAPPAKGKAKAKAAGKRAKEEDDGGSSEGSAAAEEQDPAKIEKPGGHALDPAKAEERAKAMADNYEKYKDFAPEELEKILPERPDGGITSIGSTLHALDICTPCCFNKTEKGCKDGIICKYCHMPHKRTRTRNAKRVKKALARERLKEQQKEEGMETEHEDCVQEGSRLARRACKEERKYGIDIPLDERGSSYPSWLNEDDSDIDEPRLASGGAAAHAPPPHAGYPSPRHAPQPSSRGAPPAGQHSLGAPPRPAAPSAPPHPPAPGAGHHAGGGRPSVAGGAYGYGSPAPAPSGPPPTRGRGAGCAPARGGDVVAHQPATGYYGAGAGQHQGGCCAAHQPLAGHGRSASSSQPPGAAQHVTAFGSERSSGGRHAPRPPPGGYGPAGAGQPFDRYGHQPQPQGLPGRVGPATGHHPGPQASALGGPACSAVPGAPTAAYPAPAAGAPSYGAGPPGLAPAGCGGAAQQAPAQPSSVPLSGYGAAAATAAPTPQHGAWGHAPGYSQGQGKGWPQQHHPSSHPQRQQHPHY